MPSKTTIKIFIASSGEMAAERLRVDNVFIRLNKSHKHLYLEPIKYEYDTIAGNQPEYGRLQDAIMSKLKESVLVIFLFFTKMGKYTKEEFEYTIGENKKLFTFFKRITKPVSYKTKDYNELLELKNSLDETVFKIEYKDINDFDSLLYEKLNHYLSEMHSVANTETYDKAISNLSESNLGLIRMLSEKEEKIKILEGELALKQNNDVSNELKQLIKERDSIKNELLQSEEIIRQHAKEKAELEKQLLPQKEKYELKAKAFDAVEKGNYVDAEEFLKQSAKESIDETASTFFELGKIKKLQFKYGEALHYFELAQKISPDNIEFINEAAEIAKDSGYYDKAREYIEKGLVIEKINHGEEHLKIASKYNNLGLLYNYKGEYDKAIQYYGKALTIEKKLFGNDHPEIACCYNNLGLAYDNKGEYDNAIQFYNKALTIDKKFYNNDDQNIALDYNNLGVAYSSKGEYDTAIKLYKKALRIDKKFYGEEHPEIATRYNNLGVNYYKKGRNDTAIKFFKKALTIDKKFYNDTHPSIASDYNNLGSAYNRKGEHNEAIKFFESALAIDRKFYGEEHPHIAITYSNLGLAYRNKGDYDKSIQFYQQSLSMFQKFLSPEHPNIKGVKQSLAAALAAQNNPAPPSE